MNRLIGFLLVISISLYTTPLKADSYDSEQALYTDENLADAEIPCNVSPEASSTTQSKENDSSEAYAQQDFYGETTEDQAPVETEHVQSDQGNYADRETLVTPENPEQAQRSRNRYWKNILLAVVVVAVAITALLVVNSHEGHKSHH